MPNGADDNAAIDPTRSPAPGFTALRMGTRLDNRYTIDSVIAAGGFGITYAARHEGLGRIHAIKEHFPRHFALRDAASSEIRATDPKVYTWALHRFLEEGQLLARCKHPNVVEVSDVFEANGTAYLVLGYEEGQSLAGWLKELGRRPTQAELDKLLAPLLDALQCVHAQGLLNRDVAPDNIMVRRSGSPCLIDFGAARQEVVQRSRLMSAIVKSGFSPPEQYTTSGKAQGPWSDIYALSATLYRAVVGELPPEALERLLNDTLQPIATVLDRPGDYRPGFLAGIDAALRLQQSERPQSVAAWRELLLAPEAPGSSSITLVRRTQPRPSATTAVATSAESWPRPRKPWRTQAVIAGSLLLGLLGVGMIAAAVSTGPRGPLSSATTAPSQVDAARDAEAKAAASLKAERDAARLREERRQAEEAESRRRLEEAQRQADADADAASKAAEKRRREEAEARSKAEQDRREADTRNKAEEQERQAAAAEAEAQRKAEEQRLAAEAKRKADDEKRRAVQVEIQRKAQEQQRAAAAEARRKAAEDAARLKPAPPKATKATAGGKECNCGDVCKTASFQGWINRQLCRQCRANCKG